MPDTKIRAPKATDLLREDHTRVRKLFKEYEDLEDGAREEKTELFEKIERELTIHARIEEAAFYPAIESVDDPRALKLVNEAHEEHEIVKTLLMEISALTPEDPSFDAKMKVLSESVEHHAEEEEKEIFPLFKKLDREEQRQVAEDLRARRSELSDSDEVG
jgi:hemerythrin superfamily protein